ncbi:uncharacterized protein [Montipora capricornis]|uniref:uncharacterized protein n=1 Tax=Montipora capricornis TaxID=246305 RepID=UPI0035F12FBF
MYQNENAIFPVDGQELGQVSHPSNAVHEEIIDSPVVHCTHNDGCLWKGQLRYLQMHLKQYHNHGGREDTAEKPCLEPEHPPDQSSLNEQMSSLGIAECSGLNALTEHHDSAQEDRPQGAGIERSTENMKVQQPVFDVSREEFERLKRELQEMREQLFAVNAAHNNEKQALEQQVTWFCAELNCKRVSDDKNMDVALLQSQLYHLEACNADLQARHAALQAQVGRMEGQ